MSGKHIDRLGRFQSDKYPTCPPGKVPLSTNDPAAQDLLWQYAQRRRAGSHGSREVDAEFADDLEAALRGKGYESPAPMIDLVTEEELAALNAKLVSDEIDDEDVDEVLAAALRLAATICDLREEAAERHAQRAETRLRHAAELAKMTAERDAIACDKADASAELRAVIDRLVKERDQIRIALDMMRGELAGVTLERDEALAIVAEADERARDI